MKTNLKYSYIKLFHMIKSITVANKWSELCIGNW